ncbi:hypothetical protein B0H13DRAFT_2045859, partial [Mycena leptocephala]
RTLQPHVLKELELRLNRSYHDFHNNGSTHSASHSVLTRNSSQPKAAPSPSRCKHILDEPAFWPLSSNQRTLAILMVVNLSAHDVILYHHPPVSHCHEDDTLGHRVRCSYPVVIFWLVFSLSTHRLFVDILLLVSVRLFACTSLTAYFSPLEWLC